MDPAPGPQHGHSSSATVASVLGPKSAGSNGAAHVEPSLANRHTTGIPSKGETAAAAPDDQELQRITALLQAALSLCVAQCQLPEVCAQ